VLPVQLKKNQQLQSVFKKIIVDLRREALQWNEGYENGLVNLILALYYAACSVLVRI
jgi:hypothetical protein